MTKGKKKNIGFRELDAKLDRVVGAMLTREDLKLLGKSLERKIDERIAEVIEAIDKLATAVSALNLEYAAISAKLTRYEEWFRILAKKTGVKLPI